MTVQCNCLLCDSLSQTLSFLAQGSFKNSRLRNLSRMQTMWPLDLMHGENEKRIRKTTTRLVHVDCEFARGSGFLWDFCSGCVCTVKSALETEQLRAHSKMFGKIKSVWKDCIQLPTEQTSLSSCVTGNREANPCRIKSSKNHTTSWNSMQVPSSTVYLSCTSTR